MLLAAAMLAPEARAARIVEFSLACANGDTTISWLELNGGADEVLTRGTGLRVLDRRGQTIADVPNVYGSLAGITWIDGLRRFLVATAATGDRFRYPGEPVGDFPNTILPAPLDTVAGSIILYLQNGPTQTTIDRVDYGPGHVMAPIPGTSMQWSGSAWRFQPAPVLYNFFEPIGGGDPGRTDSCFGFEHFTLTQLALACEDGDARGQYAELTLSGPNLSLDARLHVRLYDHTGALAADMANVFGARAGESVPEGTRWLLGGPTYAPPDSTPADGTLPVALDPTGGLIELSGDFYGTRIVFDSFAYGVSGRPAPAPGTAYARDLSGSLRVVAPRPTNSQGQVVVVPLCAVGATPPRLLIGELALACMNGSPEGQFVEVHATGAGVVLGVGDRLRAYGRDGALRFELTTMFGQFATGTLTARGNFLLAPGAPLGLGPDRFLPDTLDRVAGRLEIVRSLGTSDTIMASIAWGDSPLLRPPPGSCLAQDLTGIRVSTYPTPTRFDGTSLALPGCHLQRGPRRLEVDELGLACADQSSDGFYLELGALDTLVVNDATLGLRLLSNVEMARVFPLFPKRTDWPALAGRHWLVAGPAFAARAGDDPDAVLAPAPHGTPFSVALFRRDPATLAESTLAAVTVPVSLLEPGRAARRLADGTYERAAQPLPERFDGKVVQPSGCWILPRPEQAAIHAVFLRCRDGDLSGQYVELEATSAETEFAPELLLRLYDRNGQLLGERPAPYPPAYAGRAWPEDAHVLVGAPGFAARFGSPPDAALPAVLDTVAGRVQLLLSGGGNASVLLDEVSYGSSALPAPTAGASIERTVAGFTRNVLPSPSGLASRYTAPTACLGECPARTVQFALGGAQALSGDTATVTAPGTEFTYDTAGGVFQLDSHLRDLTVRWSDRYRIEGVPLGTPLNFVAQVRTILASADSCFGNRCFASLASVTLASPPGSDSAAAKPDPRRVLAVPVVVNAGESFPLDLGFRANANANPALAATVLARLEFAGLPPGARVESCHGFDTRAQRGIGEPEVVAAPREVTVRWPVTGPPGFSALIERSADDGPWEPLETRGTDPDGTLRVVDRTVLPEHRYAYRTGWSDVFASYSAPLATATTPRQPGFDYAGPRPNPSRGELSVSLELPEASEVRFDVLDVAGRVVLSRSRWLGAGPNVIPLATDRALAPGVYVVRLSYRDLVVRRTAVVLR